MADTLDVVRDRLVGQRAEQRRAVSDRVADHALTARLGGRQFLAGDRVFDTVSGKEGAIEASAAGAASAVPLYSVRFADRTMTIRAADQLIPRPTPPGAQP